MQRHTFTILCILIFLPAFVHANTSCKVKTTPKNQTKKMQTSKKSTMQIIAQLFQNKRPTLSPKEVILALKVLRTKANIKTIAAEYKISPKNSHYNILVDNLFHSIVSTLIYRVDQSKASEADYSSILSELKNYSTSRYNKSTGINFSAQSMLLIPSKIIDNQVIMADKNMLSKSVNKADQDYKVSIERYLDNPIVLDILLGSKGQTDGRISILGENLLFKFHNQFKSTQFVQSGLFFKRALARPAGLRKAIYSITQRHSSTPYLLKRKGKQIIKSELIENFIESAIQAGVPEVSIKIYNRIKSALYKKSDNYKVITPNNSNRPSHHYQYIIKGEFTDREWSYIKPSVKAQLNKNNLKNATLTSSGYNLNIPIPSHNSRVNFLVVTVKAYEMDTHQLTPYIENDRGVIINGIELSSGEITGLKTSYIVAMNNIITNLARESGLIEPLNHLSSLGDYKVQLTEDGFINRLFDGINSERINESNVDQIIEAIEKDIQQLELN